MIDRRDINYTEGGPMDPHVGGVLLPTPAVPEIADLPSGTLISGRQEQIGGPTPVDIGLDLGLATLGPIGWLGAGWLNRDKPPHMQLPTGQVGEVMLTGSPAYGAYNLFVDKPEGGILQTISQGGGMGMIPKMPEFQGGILAPLFQGDVFNILGGGGGGGFLPTLPSFDDIKMPLILAGAAIAGIYLLGKAIK